MKRLFYITLISNINGTSGKKLISTSAIFCNRVLANDNEYSKREDKRCFYNSRFSSGNYLFCYLFAIKSQLAITNILNEDKKTMFLYQVSKISTKIN